MLKCRLKPSKPVKFGGLFYVICVGVLTPKRFLTYVLELKVLGIVVEFEENGLKTQTKLCWRV
ncbi:hypothetical protein CAFE_27770 [Caprobacter fermentans]|uniref:Uncharacterized protein n=1 Tax=Caproicibacter fermentans TaxID=2576756 RepID=A0A6N8I280_9FIRM|nr:hypothetical protein [Caproicibacter fermentans]OCN03018.1 hypothetical protein A7X67_03760 [Clostridium sp. W14A]